MPAVDVGVDKALDLVRDAVALADVHVQPAVHGGAAEHIVQQYGRGVVVFVHRRSLSAQHQMTLVDFFFDADVKASWLGRVHALGCGTFGGPGSAKLLGQSREAGY